MFDLLDSSVLGGPVGNLAAVGGQQQTAAHSVHAGNNAAGAGLGAGRVLKHALLQPQETGRRPLRIREDGQGRVIVPGLSEVCSPCALSAEAVTMTPAME